MNEHEEWVAAKLLRQREQVEAELVPASKHDCGSSCNGGCRVHVLSALAQRAYDISSAAEHILPRAQAREFDSWACGFNERAQKLALQAIEGSVLESLQEAIIAAGRNDPSTAEA